MLAPQRCCHAAECSVCLALSRSDSVCQKGEKRGRLALLEPGSLSPRVELAKGLLCLNQGTQRLPLSSGAEAARLGLEVLPLDSGEKLQGGLRPLGGPRMTAEVAVINRGGVALAADSAVTIDRGGTVKIFQTENKLFELSETKPIGLMIYNNTDFFWSAVGSNSQDL